MLEFSIAPIPRAKSLSFFMCHLQHVAATVAGNPGIKTTWGTSAFSTSQHVQIVFQVFFRSFFVASRWRSDKLCEHMSNFYWSRSGRDIKKSNNKKKLKLSDLSNPSKAWWKRNRVLTVAQNIPIIVHRSLPLRNRREMENTACFACVMRSVAVVVVGCKNGN